MKRMKKIVSVLLAMVMVLGMSITVLADGPYKITIEKNDKDEKNHVYEAYQIFAGDLAENPAYETDKTQPEFILSNIQWGSGIKNETTDKSGELLAALKADSTIGSSFASIEATDSKAAAKVADVIKKFASSDANSVEDIDVFAKIVGKYLNGTVAGASVAGGTEITGLEAGYYMVKDKDGQFGGNDENASYTRLLLQVVGDSTVVVKSEVPSGEKEIFYQGTDAYYNNGAFVPNPDIELDPRLNESNYASMGDRVTFQITSTVPNYNGYDYYYFIMNDTMSNGLTFEPTSVSVKVGDKVLVQGKLDNQGNVTTGDQGEYYLYTDAASTGGATFKIAFKDIMETVTVNGVTTQRYPIGANIVVTYSAIVNEDAIIGSAGNENAWSIDYSRDPNNGSGYGRNPQNPHPGLPDVNDTDVLGKTPDQRTLTFLTELDITKYANGTDLTQVNNHILGGAEFTLTGTSYKVVMAGGTDYVESADGTYYKLLDGSYTETVPTDDEYQLIGTGNANTTKGYLKNVDGVYYVPADVKEYDGKEIYTLKTGSVSLYANTDVKYAETEIKETKVEEVPISIKLTSDPVTGRLSFKGLGEGTYTLTETKTPAGYNTIDPIEFTIMCELPEKVETGNETCTWTISWDDADETNGIFAADVINMSGALLPSTGGIGTTIFYVGGSILVLAAVVLLVTKKRMSHEK